MKKTFPAIFILLLLGQAFHLPLEILWLEGQREAIALRLCVNREKPELMCQGSCYINQVVSETVEQGSSGEKLPVTQQEQQLFSVFLPAGLFFPPPPGGQPGAQPGYRPAAHFAAFAKGVFRPPRLPGAPSLLSL
ncbi:MAG: hypothetical protein J5I98_09125 [Phaeodactylibacter sp.]|nr:hypothetical protein [Phaeodactylibacter sp.]